MRDGNGIEQRLTRKQRKELGRKIWSGSPGLDVVHRDAAGIDTGSREHYVAVGPDRASQPVRAFACFTTDLHRLAEWLQECRIKTVVMQSTGVYWIPVYDVLEQHGFDVWLVNARDTRNLPGRKIGIQESEWLLKLHTYGLLRKSFRPTPEINHVWRPRCAWRRARCARAKVISAHRSSAGAPSWEVLRRLSLWGRNWRDCYTACSSTGRNAWAKARLYTKRNTVNSKSDYSRRRPLNTVSPSFLQSIQPEEKPVKSAICERLSGERGLIFALSLTRIVAACSNMNAQTREWLG